MNDLDLCLEVVSRLCQPLRYIWCWISRKPLEIEVWFQRTTNRKWHMGYQMVTWPMTSPDPKICCTVGYPSSLASCILWYQCTYKMQELCPNHNGELSIPSSATCSMWHWVPLQCCVLLATSAACQTPGGPGTRGMHSWSDDTDKNFASECTV